jgi:protein-S-isoprenylcysteine O-methyltransferase Ste14
MTIYNWLIVACWGVFIVYWAISAFSTKRNARGHSFIRGFLFRAALAILVVVVLRAPIAGWFGEALAAGAASPWVGVIAVLCAALGIAYAVWARSYLGANWGMPMSVKENPDLITTGPYAYSRHPIYTGVILAIFGSTLIGGLWWLTVFIVVCIYFVYAAYQEERILMKEFPEAYPRYKAHTKMLIPFIF